MSSVLNAQSLQQHIVHDKQVCTQLLTLLQKEQEALKERDADTVDSLLEQKLPLLEKLEFSARQRQEWLKAREQQGEGASWAVMLDELNQSPLTEAWAEVKSLYKKVREQNEMNGKLLSRHQSTVNRMLDILRGTSSSPNLYNASGYSSGRASSNKFGEA